MSGKSRFDAYGSFIHRRHRWIIVAWIVLALVMSTQLPNFFASVNFNIVGSGSGSGNLNSESQKAQAILNAEFPKVSNESDNSIIVVLQGAQVYSNQVKNSAISLNETLADSKVTNYTGMTSIYDAVSSLLNSTVPSLLPQVNELGSNISQINAGLHILESNLSSLNANLFEFQNGINQTALLIYGIPASFVQIWAGIIANSTNPYLANSEANATLYQMSSNFGGNNESIGYYTLFYQLWNSTFQNPSMNSISPTQRESISVNESAGMFRSSPGIDNQTRQIIATVSSGLNVTNWNEREAVANLTMSSVAAQVPSSLSSTLGVTPSDLVDQLYALGASPSNASLATYTINLFTITYSRNFTSPVPGFSISALLHSAYDLGTSPTANASWDLASQFIANSTSSAFSGSPLFVVNSTSLTELLVEIGPNATASQVHSQINTMIEAKSFYDYPLVPESSITRSLVAQDNASMIILLNFASSPDANEISQVNSDIQNSSLTKQGTIYVTGSPVLINDIQNTFQPALGIGIGPGIVVSLIVVGLLFLAPIAAIIPLLIGGISIGIGLPAMYLGIVDLGHGSITFLTPTLATLLMLGLAVDYSVLQLRRTKEERLNGKTMEESVRISIRWAGQAVLTAGITVIVAYIVMAVANVPLFSDVGTAIALGVSILLIASLTLLPSLELAIGDRLFWPSMRKGRDGSFASRVKKKSRLRGVAEFTLKRKVAIATIISLMAIGSLYFTFNTPIGADFLKLVPNFPSNQGLTVIYNSLGSGTVAPTMILVTTQTPIVYGNNQFNDTLLNEIELISDRAANSSGVTTVVGPTRPFGSAFDYSSVQNMSDALRVQYLEGMMSQIGKNNETALISVGLKNDSESQAGTNALLKMEKSVNGLTLPNGVVIYYGGDAQSTYDSVSFIVGLLPEIIAILASAVYVILFAQLRSAFTPLRLIFTVLCSVVFSLGMISLVFNYALKLPILDFAPLFVVVTMLGVGIDYDIFFVTRIREEVLKGKTDNEAIKTAVEKVWITIFGLGLILASVFASLLLTGIAIFQEICLAVSVAILIDVVVVILFFVPSLMGLAQGANWWPSNIGKVSEPKENKV